MEKITATQLQELLTDNLHGLGFNGDWYVTQQKNGIFVASIAYQPMNEDGYYDGDLIVNAKVSPDLYLVSVNFTANSSTRRKYITGYSDYYGDTIANALYDIKAEFTWQETIRERLSKLPADSYDLVTYTEGDLPERVPYGYLKPVPSWKPYSRDYILVWKLSESSGYSGCSVHMANYRSLLKIASEYTEKSIFEIYGGFGYQAQAIGISLDCGIEAIWGAITDASNNYPVIDDAELLEIELELQEESWEGGTKQDFRNLIEEQLDVIEPEEGYTVEGVTDWELWELFQTLCERGNVYWDNEYNYMTIDLGRVVSELQLSDLREFAEFGKIVDGVLEHTPTYRELESAGQLTISDEDRC